MAKKIVHFHQDNATAHTFMKAMVKMNGLKCELFHHSPYSPDLSSSNYLLPRWKWWLLKKRLSSTEDVECETDSYFVALEKSHYMQDTEMLQSRWNNCIALEGTMLMSKIHF